MSARRKESKRGPDRCGSKRKTEVPVRKPAISRGCGANHLLALLAREELALIGEGLVHQMNNSLMAVTNNLEVALMSETALDREVLVDALSAASRLADLVVQMSECLHANDPGAEPVNLGKMADLVVQRVFRKEKNRVQVLEAKGVPPVVGKAGMHRGILTCLVSNAREASPAGAPVVIRISVRSKPHRRVVLQISDQGDGMTPEVLSQVGTPFFTTKPCGAGLGLYISRELARQAGGEMRIESVRGSGTTVHLEWPPA